MKLLCPTEINSFFFIQHPPSTLNSRFIQNEVDDKDDGSSGGSGGDGGETQHLNSIAINKNSFAPPVSVLPTYFFCLCLAVCFCVFICAILFQERMINDFLLLRIFFFAVTW